ncbi:MAG: Uma2 family endonuclease [Planctomycetota bacterium]|nr:MAG: Uma2 family endonuclease [Planctomycetota bacterium]REJ87502.1 MAG: Uma2 family endonuclease [Planctomycetota bacterium]REK30613.1 MAG: Uma2 family endonuclease [Planctomycetota bacterium]REK32987.1 MAG: Uma2 family endonuclease [Planctomycetota bacterium]
MSTAELKIPGGIGPRCNGMLMTTDEFDAADDWEPGYRYELVHGVLIVSPPAGIGERKPNDELGYWLMSYRDTHAQGSALDDTAPEHTLKTSTGRRRADRVIWTGLGRTPDYENDVPSIAIEFVSERSRDRKRDYEEKPQEYADAGVREYWVIDRFARSLTVFRGPQGRTVLREGDVYATDLLPGFELSVSRLLEIADRCKGRPS